ITATGPTNNEGVVTMNGSRYDVQFVPDNLGPALLRNTGAVNTVGASPLFDSPGDNPVATIQNDGAMSFWNPTGGAQSAGIDENVTGSGTIQINPNTRVVLSRAVGADQTVDFSSDVNGNSFLQIASPSTFQALISGFTQGKTI